MIRKLLATTALTALLTGGAYAQNSDMDGDHMTVFTPDAVIEMEVQADGYFAANANQILASSLLGKTIYNGTGEDAEAIGDVNDVVMAPNGMAQAIVVGVGGFLGIGEKEVAVDFSRVNWVMVDDERRLIIDGATKEQLENAPEFDRDAFDEDHDSDMEKAENDMKMSSDDKEMDSPREGMTIVDRSTLSAETLIGTRVYGSDDDDVGEIGDVILSADGQVEAYIVDVGGFLGIGEKPVALDASQLDIMQDANGDLKIFTSYTEDQLENQPAYDEDEYKTNPDAVILR